MLRRPVPAGMLTLFLWKSTLPVVPVNPASVGDAWSSDVIRTPWLWLRAAGEQPPLVCTPTIYPPGLLRIPDPELPPSVSMLS